MGVAITPDGKHPYFTNFKGNLFQPGTVSVIATAANTFLTTVKVRTGPFGVAVTPDGKLAYVTNYGSNSVSVIATSSNQVVANIVVENQPLGDSHHLGW